MNFEKELEKGNFLLGECHNCKNIVWPPSEFCNKCFGVLNIKKVNPEGRIVEFSRYKDSYFCVGEFDRIKIIGKISSGIPKNDQRIKIKRCGIREKNYFFEFALIN